MPRVAGGFRVPGLAGRIKSARQSAGLTVQELADRIGLALRSLYQIEDGRSDPSAATLRAMAEALAVTADWLLDVNGEQPVRP